MPWVHSTPTPNRICQRCGKAFYRCRAKVRAGGGKFCSPACYHGPKTVAPRFWANVQMTDSCWLWTGALCRDGYGRFGNPKAGARQGAHRFSWILSFGPIPDGMSVLHKCDNPRCVRPAHLFLGTQLDNIRDMNTKGRTYRFVVKRGEKSNAAKVTEADVREIRRRYRFGGVTHKQLAQEFGISASAVGFIISGRNWGHVR